MRCERECLPCKLVAVVDLGPDADYTSEPRHHVEVAVPFSPSPRSSIRQLGMIRSQVERQLWNYLPPNHKGFHIWLLDRRGRPTLFISGLLAARERPVTKKKMEVLNATLLPMFSSEQKCQAVAVVVRAHAEADEEIDDDIDEDDDIEYGREDELISDRFSELDCYELSDSSHDGGYVWVAVEGWKRVSLNLPFVPSAESTPSQLRFAVQQALQRFEADLYDGTLTDDYGPPDVWLMDGTGKPTLNIAALAELAEGRLSKAQYRKVCEAASTDIPMRFLEARSAA